MDAYVSNAEYSQLHDGTQTRILEIEQITKLELIESL